MRRFLVSILLLTLATAGVLTHSATARDTEGDLEVDEGRQERVAPGISFREDSVTLADGSPLEAQVLEVNPANKHVDLEPVLANDRVVEKETVGSMDSRYDATASINGGYFVVGGPYAGDPTGAYLLDGEVVSDGMDRTAVLFCQPDGFRDTVEIDQVDFSGSVTSSDGATRSVDVANGARGTDQLVVYREIFGNSTLTDSSGVEVILDGSGNVREVREGVGDSPIPPDGSVLSGSGTAAEWLKQHARVGSRLDVETSLTPEDEPNGCAEQDIVGAGPNLLTDGRVDITTENFGHEDTRNPRTALGVTGSGKFLLVTVDGRSAESVGVTLDELAEYMVLLGAEDAMNLDGGGSSTMVVRDRVRNTPSDGQQRPVSDGIMVYGK